MNQAPAVALANTEDEYELDWSSRKACLCAAGLYVLACLVRLVLNRLVKAPYIFNDEYRYIELARSAFGPRGFYLNGVAAQNPCWFYPLLIAPALKLWPFQASLWCIQFLNTLMLNLAVPLVFLWAREAISRRRAVLAAALTALLPMMGFSATVMTESAFFPAATLCLWLMWRHILRPGAWRGLLAGLAAALAFHIKPHGLLLPQFFIPFALVAEWLRPRELGRNGYYLEREPLGRRLARHLWVPLGMAIGLLPRFAAIHWIEHPGEPFRASFFLGIYHAQGFEAPPFNAGVFTGHFVQQALTWLACCGVFPAYVALLEGWRALRGRYSFERRMLAALAVIASAVVVPMIARHLMITGEHEIPLERYLFIVYPPVLILFANYMPLGLHRVWRPMAVAAGLYPALLFWIFVRDNYSLMSNAPGLAGAFVLGQGWRFWGNEGWTFAVLLAIGVAGCMFQWRRARVPRLGLILLLVALNAGWYCLHAGGVRRALNETRRMASKIDLAAGPRSRVYVLVNHYEFTQYLGIAARHNSRLVSWRDKSLGWMDSPLPGNGIWRAPSVEGEAPWFFAHESVRLAGLGGKRIGNGFLYKLAPGQTVQLTQAKGKPGKSASANKNAQADAKPLPLRVTLAGKTAFKAGQPGRAAVRIENRSAKPFPAGKREIWIGYHWSDPQRTKSWQAVVWDDRRGVKIPTLKPGEARTLELPALAPRPASGTWLFELQPYEARDGKKNWLKTDQPAGEWVTKLGVKP